MLQLQRVHLINNKYKPLEKIGEGAFGSIYKGENIRTKELVAIKVEPIECDLKLLKNESKVYQLLQNLNGIPTVKWFGRDDNNYYMVINLLGDSLETLLKRKQAFSLKLIQQMGIQMIQLLKAVHECGLVHRDVKPDNFLLGLHGGDKARQIHLIDFGFCKAYRRHDGSHIQLTTTKNLIGTPIFASINAHKHLELSRRDDLESLGYMLWYFYKGGNISWTSHTLTSEEIMREKEELVSKKENSLDDNIFIDFLVRCRQLEFEETPLYDTYMNRFAAKVST